MGKPIELAIVDVELDRIGKNAFAQLARQGSGFPSPKLLWLSSMVRDGQDEIHLGNDAAIVHKPIHRLQLLETVTGLLAPSQEDGKGAAATSSPGGGDAEVLGLRVLVAEDNPINQFVATEYLSEFGCEVVVAENGKQALARALAEPFDVILMDFQMPEMDGLTSARLIREEWLALGVTPVPIIALTANAFKEDRKACLRAGMVDHISKPFTAQTLKETLLKWCVGAKSQNKPDDARPARERQAG